MAQVEGLRLWRLAALQGLPVVPLDSLWPLLAAALLPPPAPPAAGATGECSADFRSYLTPTSIRDVLVHLKTLSPVVFI